MPWLRGEVVSPAADTYVDNVLFPTGIESDNIFVIQDATTGAITDLSPILMWDT